MTWDGRRATPASFGVAASAKALDATLIETGAPQVPVFFSFFMTGLPEDLQAKATLWRRLREGIASGAYDPDIHRERCFCATSGGA